jgi:hypothetical protein
MRDLIVKILTLVDELNLRFQQLRRPPRFQSIDESMVKFKGRSKMRQTMKSKPIKSGFNLCSRCDDQGYTYQFKIYHGTQIGNAEAKRNRKNEATDQVVLDLCAPLAEKWHIVAFDSFFTSVSVMDKLLRKRDERSWHDQSDPCQPADHARKVIEARRVSGQSWKADRDVPKESLPMERPQGISRCANGARPFGGQKDGSRFTAVFE